jgi:aminoglycoside phosphotransferase
MEKWLGYSRFRKIRNVIIHGDATPTNFLFTGNADVAAIDLERMKVFRHGVRYWNGLRGIEICFSLQDWKPRRIGDVYQVFY